MSQTRKSNISLNSNSTYEDKMNKDEMNYLLLIFLVSSTIIIFVGTIYLFLGLENYWAELKIYIPEDYDVPNIKDSIIVIKAVPLIIISKLIFEKYSKEFIYKNVLSKKYKNLENKELFAQGLIYKSRLATNFFKIFYYIFVIVCGHFIFKQSDTFPWELFGSGEFSKMFETGHLNLLFWKMPQYFKEYYLISLSYVLVDFFWLVFINELSTDFLFNLLHHSATICLIFFSYATQQGQPGSVILYMHDLSGVFVYIIKTAIQTDCPKFITILIAIITLFAFVFYRCLYLSKIIYTFGYGTQSWNIYNLTLWRFLFFLLFLQIYWTYELFKRIVKVQFVDIGKVKKIK